MSQVNICVSLVLCIQNEACLKIQGLRFFAHTHACTAMHTHTRTSCIGGVCRMCVCDMRTREAGLMRSWRYVPMGHCEKLNKYLTGTCYCRRDSSVGCLSILESGSAERLSSQRIQCSLLSALELDLRFQFIQLINLGSIGTANVLIWHFRGHKAKM